MTLAGKSSNSQTGDEVNSKLATADHYLVNAQEMASKHEFRKAAEMLWGGITQTLKALAAAEGGEIRNHSAFFDFARTLATTKNDPYLYMEFLDLNALHKHFYDETIPHDAFPAYNQRTLNYVGKLNNLLREWEMRGAGLTRGNYTG
jgi:hypothetical protein